MAEFHKYGTSGKFYVPLLLASTQNFASTSVITFASSDVTIVKDGSTYRDLTNTPTGVAMGSGAIFEVVTSASEMTAGKIAIQIKDETGALVQDQMIVIDTYGSTLAAHAFDLNQTIESSTLGTVTRFGTTAQNFITDELNDVLFTDASSDATDSDGSLGNKVSWLYQRFFRHVQQDGSTQAIMTAGSTSVTAGTMTVTETTDLQAKGELST